MTEADLNTAVHEALGHCVHRKTEYVKVPASMRKELRVVQLSVCASCAALEASFRPAPDYLEHGNAWALFEELPEVRVSKHRNSIGQWIYHVSTVGESAAEVYKEAASQSFERAVREVYLRHKGKLK